MAGQPKKLFVNQSNHIAQLDIIVRPGSQYRNIPGVSASLAANKEQVVSYGKPLTPMLNEIRLTSMVNGKEIVSMVSCVSGSIKTDQLLNTNDTFYIKFSEGRFKVTGANTGVK